MEQIKILPSKNFLEVLEELKTCGDVPRSIKEYFTKRSCDDDIIEDKLQLSDTDNKLELSDTDNKLELSDTDNKLELSDTDNKLYLTTNDIKWCHSKIKERGISHRIHKLLEESEVILPKYEPPPRSPELEARIRRLKAEQNNREYRSMTKNVDFLQPKVAINYSDFGKDVKEMNRQIVAGMQYIVSIVGTFFAIFIGSGFAIPDYGERALLGIIAALAVAMAEIYFIIRNDIREEEERLKSN